MSYIDIEKKDRSYRIILGRHDNETPSSQLPNNCTGILLEGTYTNLWYFLNRLSMESGIELKPNMKWTEREGIFQYREILIAASNKDIPVGAAEADKVRISTVIDFHYMRDTLFHPIRLLELFIAGNSLGDSDQPIDKNSINYKLMRHFAEWLISHPSRTGRRFSPRNLLMAQRTEAFSSYQLSQGIERPSIALVVGASHLTIEDDFNLDPSSRVALLQQTPYLGQYFDLENLGRIYYTHIPIVKAAAIPFFGGIKYGMPPQSRTDLNWIYDSHLGPNNFPKT